MASNRPASPREAGVLTEALDILRTEEKVADQFMRDRLADLVAHPNDAEAHMLYRHAFGCHKDVCIAIRTVRRLRESIEEQECAGRSQAARLIDNLDQAAVKLPITGETP